MLLNKNIGTKHGKYLFQPPPHLVLPLALSQGFRQVYRDADARLSYIPVEEDRDHSQGPGLLTI